MTTPLVGLLDCNNFYVSCERVFRPDLKNRPAVVLSNNDGCVISRSNETKALGIPMGAPYFKVKDILESNGAIVFSSNFALYGDLSFRVMYLLEMLSPQVEIYSIDEAFIDFTGITNPQDLATNIRKQILQQIGIPTCVGVSLTKTLAKVANRVAKKNPNYNGVCILTDKNDIDNILKNMDPEDIWGIGRRSADKLKNFGISNALQLKQADPRWIRKYFTITGERIVMELNGIMCLEIDDIVAPRQSIQVTRTFSGGITEFDKLRERIVSFASRIGEKLRQQNLETQTVSLFIQTNHHKKDSTQYRKSGVTTLPFPTNDSLTLVQASIRVLESLFRSGYSFSRAGVMVHDLISSSTNSAQLMLFKDPMTHNPKIASLMSAMDSLNKKYGKETVKVASAGSLKRQPHVSPKKKTSNQFYLSPAYTTKWSDLPVVI